MAVNPYHDRSQRRHRLAAMTRRNFLLLMGDLGALGSVLFGGVAILKFVFPAAIDDQSPPKFVVSVPPDQITVDRPYMDYGHRTGMIRDDAGLYAVQLICTHLGCTPNYVTDVTTGSGGGALCCRRSPPPHAFGANSQRLGVSMPWEPLLHRLDQRLRSGAATDGLVRHPVRA